MLSFSTPFWFWSSLITVALYTDTYGIVDKQLLSYITYFLRKVKNPPLPPHALFLTDKNDLNGIPYKIKWKIHACLVHCISSFEGAFYKKCKTRYQFCYFLLFYISFYIKQISFLQLFRTLFYIFWKSNSHYEFSFVNVFTQSSNPLNDQNPLSVTKLFCRCSLTIIPISFCYFNFKCLFALKSLKRSRWLTFWERGKNLKNWKIVSITKYFFHKMIQKFFDIVRCYDNKNSKIHIFSKFLHFSSKLLSS